LLGGSGDGGGSGGPVGREGGRRQAWVDTAVLQHLCARGSVHAAQLWFSWACTIRTDEAFIATAERLGDKSGMEPLKQAVAFERMLVNGAAHQVQDTRASGTSAAAPAGSGFAAADEPSPA